MKFKLTRIAGGAEFEITRSLVAGRLAECDIQLTQGLPSRRHGQLSLSENEVWVEDLGSANGTFVNGVRIEAKTKLASGDLVRFDLEEFRFIVEGAAEDAAGAPTMYRAPPPKTAAESKVEPKVEAPSEAAAKVEPKKEPAKEQVAESSGIYKRPGAWADPDSDDGANKTKFMDSAALKALIDHAPKANAAVQGAVDAPSLVIVSGSRSGTRIKLQAQRGKAAEWSMGTGAECEVQFTEDGVSALHAKIVNDGQRWKLIDQMSANGSYVNGKRSTMSYLSAGDRIAIGPVECEFQLPESMRQTVTEEMAPKATGKAGRARLMAIVVAAIAIAAVVIWLWSRA